MCEQNSRQLCDDGLKCIDNNRVCNGDYDCYWGRDEKPQMCKGLLKEHMFIFI